MLTEDQLNVAVAELAAFKQIMPLVRFLAQQRQNPVGFRTSFVDAGTNESVTATDSLDLSGPARLQLLGIAYQLAWRHAGPLLALGVQVDISELPPPPPPSPAPAPAPSSVPEPSPSPDPSP
jgi:hypothetical protein